MEIVDGQKNVSIKDQAKAELIEDRTKEFKKELKSLLKQEQDAKVVLANIRREIEFTEKKIDQEISDINS